MYIIDLYLSLPLFAQFFCMSSLHLVTFFFFVFFFTCNISNDTLMQITGQNNNMFTFRLWVHVHKDSMHFMPF